MKKEYDTSVKEAIERVMSVSILLGGSIVPIVISM